MIMNLDHLERPEGTGLHLTFRDVRFDLYRLDGLLWIRKDPLARLLAWIEPTNDRSVYGRRYYTAFSTRVVALEPFDKPGAPLWPCRLFTLWGATLFAKRTRSALSAEFIAWAHAMESSADAPPGLCAELWRATDMKPPTKP